MAEPLPIFPLGTVLYPGLLLPLNIFEPRYRQLVADLLERPEEEQRFGVVAIRQGRETGVDGVDALYDIGCAAALRRVEKEPDGRYLLVTVGTERFRLEALDEASDKPYLQGLVTWLDEPDGEGAQAKVEPVQRAFTSYLQALGSVRGTELDVPELPDDARQLSYLVAASLVSDMTEKQAMLAAVTTSERLAAEAALLRQEQLFLTMLTAAPAPELTRYPQSPN